MKPHHILLADDDQDHMELMRMSLNRASPSSTVETASNRDELLRLASSNQFDCVVLDFYLQRFTAPELLVELAPLQPSVPCVVVSSSEAQAVVIESLRLGVSDFVPKDSAISEGVLWNRVEAAVQKAQHAQQEKRRINRRLTALSEEARTDALTGLPNRRAIDDYLNDLRSKNDRRASSAVILVDLDHFKDVNDELGHAEGDRVLREASDVIRRVARQADIVGRWGGEEFVILCQSCSLSRAWEIAERCRAALPECVQVPEGFRAQTGSFGIHHSKGGLPDSTALERADEALYLAKRLGRNRVRTSRAAELQSIVEQSASKSLAPAQAMNHFLKTIRDSLGPNQAGHIAHHGSRVQRLVCDTLRQQGTSDFDYSAIELAAKFHDIGKCAIPEEMLALPRKLTELEHRIVSEHVDIGADLLRACSAPELAVSIVDRHHERYDANSDANHAVDAKPHEVLAICDAYDAMTSDRPYSVAKSKSEAVEEIQSQRGTQFHPTAVDALLGTLEACVTA